MNNFRKSLAALAVAASLSSAVPAMAASNTQGGLVGHSSVANATVTVKNVDTGMTRTVESDGSGAFRFNLLPAGKYEVFAHKDGVGDTAKVNFGVFIGQNAKVDLKFDNGQDNMEVIEVRSSGVAMIDTTSSESVMIMDSSTINLLPVARDITSVALLAPGTNQGDSAFEGDGTLASFSGASVGENAYYINGLNTTNFRNGLGGSQVPFEFYEQFEVKSGGYGAEYGRSTGGVITAITKSGGNDFKFGVSAFYEPDSFSEDKPNSYDANGNLVQINDQDYSNNYNYNVYASGALIEDTLFYYVLLNPSRERSRFHTSTLTDTSSPISFYSDDQKAFFWGLNVDWYINDDNSLELTAFSDKRKTDRVTSNWDEASGFVTNPTDSTIERGGINGALKYTSIITDSFQLSAMYGINKADRTDASEFDATCPWVYDSREGGLTKMGCWANSNTVQADDERKAFRLDMDWIIGDHSLRFGFDVEDNAINNIEQYSGGRYYRYYTASEGQFDGLNEGDQYYRLIERISSGSFKTKTSAFYLEDKWQVTDNLMLTLGLRNETFDNKNIAGESFIKVDNQWAPRIGMSWDVAGDGETKVFANYGRYYLPVAANTNLRLAGAELYTRRYFKLDGVGADSLPTNDYYGAIKGTTADHADQLGGTTVYDDGIPADVRTIVDNDIKPMFQNEFILGVEQQLNSDWLVGARFTYRDLASSLEDIAIDAGLQRYADEHTPGVDLGLGGFDYYVLTNPGEELSLYVDADGDGQAENIVLTPDQLGYPKATRTYTALSFTFERAWDKEWMLQGSYTWSHTWGNTEGAVRSDNGQDDAGLTTNFDQPGLTDFASGNLPTDRRHQFKVFGGYSLTENLMIGGNFSWASGRPRSAFGYHPTDLFAQAYGSESFYQNGTPVPRGALGTTPNTWSVDLNMKYIMDINDVKTTFSLDVFNLFNNDSVRQVYEIADSEDSGHFEGVGTHTPDPYFGVADNFQSPRYVRLSASVRF